MHPQQTRLMLLLSGLLLLCCALLALPSGEPEAETQDGIVGPMAASTVEHLALHTPEGSLEAHQRAGEWFLTHPKAAMGDPAVLDDLVEATSRWEVTATLSSASPSDHGLVPPQYTLQLRSIDGAAPTLKVGAVAPGGAHTYAQVDDGPVLILEGNVTGLLSRPLEIYRRRVLHVFAESAILRVDWQLDGEAWSVARNPEGQWLQGGGDPVRTGVIEGFLAALAATRLESFQDDLDPGALGLVPPRGQLVLSSSDGEWELAVGIEKLGGTLVRSSDGLTGTIGALPLLFPSPDSLNADPIAGPAAD